MQRPLFFSLLLRVLSRRALGLALVFVGVGVGLGVGPGPAMAAAQPEPVQAASPRRANFQQEQPSADARHVADWVVDSADSVGMPFIIVDKVDARVFVFEGDGRLRGASPVLIGLALGDQSVPGIGSRKLSTIRPDERTTPAGRFVAHAHHEGG